MQKVFVYGGCVTRDVFELLKENHDLSGYVARQSLISASSPPSTLGADLSEGTFEMRAVKGDLLSSLHSSLTESPQTDVFVMDLLVERFGVFELPNGSFVTRTPNLKKSGALGDLWDTVPYFKMGTDQHFDLWAASLRTLKEHLINIGLFHKTLLFDTPWASINDDGSPVVPFAGWTAESAEKKYARYYDLAKQLGFVICRLPKEMAVSTVSHKWESSPYHYSLPAYEWMRDEILEFLSHGKR